MKAPKWQWILEFSMAKYRVKMIIKFNKLGIYDVKDLLVIPGKATSYCLQHH